jgi:anti-sigma B factor antagonist
VTVVFLPVSTGPSSLVAPARRPAARPLTVTVRPGPAEAVVLSVRGEVDMSTGPFLQQALLSHLDDAASQVTVDLTGVSFLGAAGLAVLVNVKRAAVAAQSRLRLVARTRVVLLPLTITGLAGEFDIYPALADVPSCPGD